MLKGDDNLVKWVQCIYLKSEPTHCLNVTFHHKRNLLFIQAACCSGGNLVCSFTPIVAVVIATASSETTVGPHLWPGAIE